MTKNRNHWWAEQGAGVGVAWFCTGYWCSRKPHRLHIPEKRRTHSQGEFDRLSSLLGCRRAPCWKCGGKISVSIMFWGEKP